MMLFKRSHYILHCFRVVDKFNKNGVVYICRLILCSILHCKLALIWLSNHFQIVRFFNDDDLKNKTDLKFGIKKQSALMGFYLMYSYSWTIGERFSSNEVFFRILQYKVLKVKQNSALLFVKLQSNRCIKRLYRIRQYYRFIWTPKEFCNTIGLFKLYQNPVISFWFI